MLTRMITCFHCQVVDASPHRSHRLRNGAVDLHRIKKTTEQTEEYYAPCPINPVEEPVPSPIKGDNYVSYVERLKRVSGMWTLDKSKSDALTPMCEMLELNWMIRKAMENADTMQIRVDGDTLQQSGRVMKILDIHEKLNLRGEPVVLRRRDMRQGQVSAQTFLTPLGYINKLHWQDPCAGGSVETMEFSEDGMELHVCMHVFRSDGQSCDLKSTYKFVCQWNGLL